jgi:hypothetical protein
MKLLLFPKAESFYQLDLITPGIWPEFENFLKQILHISNFR